MYCSPVEKPTAPSSIALTTSAFIRSSSSGVGARFALPITALRTVLWPMSVAKLIAGFAARICSSAGADLERRRSAVAGDDRRHAHADEVRRLGSRRQIVRVRVDVDETGRDGEPARVDRSRRALADPMGPTRAILPSRMPMSPVRAGAPVPSTMRALVIRSW